MDFDPSTAQLESPAIGGGDFDPSTAQPEMVAPANQPSPTPKSGIFNLPAGINEGLADIGGAPVDAMHYAMTHNPVGTLVRAGAHALGLTPQQIDKYLPPDATPDASVPAVGGSEWIKKHLLGTIGANPDDVVATTPGERLMRSIGAGISGAALPIAPEASLARNVLTGAASGAGSGAVNEVLPEGTPGPIRAAISTLGGIATGMGAASVGLKPNPEALARAQETNQLANDFEQSGVSTAGALPAITGSKFASSLKAGLDHYLASAGTMASAARQTLGDFKDYANRIAGNLGSATTQESAGRALQRGTKSFIKDFDTRAGTLYSALDKYLPASEPVQLDNTAGLIRDKLSSYAGTPNIQAMAVPPKLNGFLEDIDANNGQLTWKQVKDLRSMVGQRMSDLRDDSGIPGTTWKQLYGALSDDMQTAAIAKGPDAQKAFNRANQFYAAGRNRIDNFIKPIADSTTAEQAMSAAIRGDKTGATALRALRKSMPSEDWGDFASYQLRKMGMAKPGAQNEAGDVFSPTTFLTNWNTISPEAKDALFGGTQYAGMRSDLDRLVRMSGAMKEVEKSANTSRTAGTLAGIHTLTSTGAGILTWTHPLWGISSMVAPYGAAKVMTSPAAIRYFTRRAARIAGGESLSANTERTMLNNAVREDPDLAGYLRAPVSSGVASEENTGTGGS